MSSSYRQSWVKPIAGDVPPLKPTIYDDEFSAQRPLAAGFPPGVVLVQPSSKWTEWDPGAVSSYFAAIEPRSQMLWLGGNGDKQWSGMFEALPLPAAGETLTYTLTVRALLGEYNRFDDHGPYAWGLVLGENLVLEPDTSGLWAVYNRSSRVGTDLAVATEAATFVSYDAPPVADGAVVGAYPYLRAKVATENELGVYNTQLRFFASVDGLSWFPLAEYVDLALAIRHAALAKQTTANQPFNALFDFIRSSDPADETAAVLDGGSFQRFGTV